MLEHEKMTERSDWRADVLSQVRELILDAVPEMVEERKWCKPSNPAGVPVWSHTGIVCTGETYKSKIKLTFAHGAALPDPTPLFNAGLEGKVRRAIDIYQDDTIDTEALKALIHAAVHHNQTLKQKT